jgi:hypothetical protein
MTDNAQLAHLRPATVAELRDIIDLQNWANSLINGQEYQDPDPDYLSRALMYQTLTASSAAAILSEGGIRKLQESVTDVPGASTGPIEVDDLYVTGSDFGEGARTYIIFGGTDMELGHRVKYSTGAGQVQAQFLALVNLGVWPIKCQVKRTARKDKGGKHLFWVTTPD